MLILKEEMGKFDTIDAKQDEKAMKAIANSSLPQKERIRLGDNGFYDLEKKGLSGVGFWVGYSHNARGSSERKMYPVVKDAAHLLNKVLFGGKGVVNDFWSSSDMFRVYMVY